MEHYLVLGFLVMNAWTDICYRKVSLWSIALFSLVEIVYQWTCQREFSTMLLGLIPGLILLIISKATREALGMGDALLMLVLGLYLGLQEAIDVLMLGLFCAAVWAGVLLIVKRKKRGYEFPFVPFLLLGYIGRWILWSN